MIALLELAAADFHLHTHRAGSKSLERLQVALGLFPLRESRRNLGFLQRLQNILHVRPGSGAQHCVTEAVHAFVAKRSEVIRAVRIEPIRHLGHIRDGQQIPVSTQDFLATRGLDARLVETRGEVLRIDRQGPLSHLIRLLEPQQPDQHAGAAGKKRYVLRLGFDDTPEVVVRHPELPSQGGQRRRPTDQHHVRRVQFQAGLYFTKSGTPILLPGVRLRRPQPLESLALRRSAGLDGELARALYRDQVALGNHEGHRLDVGVKDFPVLRSFFVQAVGDQPVDVEDGIRFFHHVGGRDGNAQADGGQRGNEYHQSIHHGFPTALRAAF